MIYLYFALIVICSYFIGNVNFAKIVVGLRKKEDISQKGSGNPGTMNVLRNYGIALGALVLLLEAIKSGIPAIVSATLMKDFGYYDLAFFVSGASVILGQMYPVLYKFKGGKGIACMVGLYFFTPYWWVAIITFVCCALLLYIIDYAFISSLLFITTMAVIMLVYEIQLKVALWWVVIIIISLLWILAIIKHRGNFKRLFANKENKVGFRHKILMSVSKKYRAWIKQEENKELQKRQAAKIYLKEKEAEREIKKEEKQEEKKVKKEARKDKKATKKAKKKAKRKAKKTLRKRKKVDRRVKKLKNGKRNPFRHNRKKKTEEIKVLSEE